MPLPLLKRLPLSYKIALCSCILLILTLSTLWLLVENETRINLQLQADQVGQTLVVQTADSIRELVLANDLLGLNVVISRLTEDNSIAHITVYNVDNQVLARAGTVSPGNSPNTVYEADITLQDAVAGSVQLTLDVTPLLANLDNTRYYFWATLLLGLLLAVALSLMLASHITAPLNAISDALEDPDEGSIDTLSERQDEVSRLQFAVGKLLEKYQASRSYQLKLGGMKNHDAAPPAKSAKIMASLLIIKVVNINTAIELLHPNTLSSLLKEYQDYLKQAARLYGGTVQRYTGESVMVSFDQHSCGEDHGMNAVCCARLFLALMQKIKQQHQAKKAQALQFRLAIHSGETFFSIHEPDQSQTLLGKSLETGYFLAKQSKPGQLLISETTYSQAGAEQKLPNADSIEITMPADNMSFTAYILSPEMSSYSELIQKQCEHILPDSETRDAR